MNRIQWKDFLREIRKNKGRYLSLLFIVALGCAFYSGIRSSEPDMTASADRYYDETDFCDVRILSTLGLTDEDLEAIAEIDGVERCEGACNVELFAECEDSEPVMNVVSLGKEINRFTVKEGRLPERPDECFVDIRYINNQHCGIGDTITLLDTKKETPEELEQNAFTIVGYGTWAWYLNLTRGSASIGNGTVDAFLVLRPEVFTQDYYTTIFATVEGARAVNSYSDLYDDIVKRVTDGIDKIADVQVKARRAALVADGEKELADAREEIRDAKQELADALDELNDGEEKLADGQKEYDDGRKDYEKGKAEYEKGLREYKAGQKELAAGEAAYRDGLAEYEKGLAEYEAGRSAFEEGKAVLDASRTELDAGWTAYEAGRAAWEQNKAQLDQTEAQLSGQKQQLEAALMMGEDPVLQAQLDQVNTGLAQVSAGQAELEAGRSQLESTRDQLTAGETAYRAGLAEIEKNEAELQAAEAILTASRGELDAAAERLAAGKKAAAAGKKKLDEAKRKLKDGEQDLADAEQELIDGRKDLDDGWKEYNDAKEEADEKIAEAESEIADGEKALEDLDEGEWYVLNRDTIQTSVEYGMDAERIGKIARVFPVIFFLVAALVCLTTMTRMIEEERMLIGTMKALGYGKFAIISKYLFYAFSATLTGGVIGVLVGSKILPYVIMTAYGMLYTNVPYILLPYHFSYGATAVGLAMLCTVGAAFAACYRELLSTPAALMRPPAPKVGRKIFLERIPFLWSRLNFSLKSTVRNLLRYKKRLIMTVLGIGGCMAILLVSYGLHDSIAAIVDNQYKKIWTYSAYGNLDENILPEEKEAIAAEILKLRGNDGQALVAETMLARSISLDVSTDAATKTSYLYVVSDLEKMNHFLDLHDRVTGEKHSLTDEGVILSEKLARMLEVELGDEITLKISDSHYEKVQVADTAENYLHNYIYMTPDLYARVFDEEPVYNEVLLKYAGALEESREDALAEQILSMDGVTSVHLVRGLQESVDNMMNALNLVVWVLVIAAGLLVFVVTFNLNNINISERRRELASLKVLGFYDMEVAMYVYRENIFLTVFGIVAGLFMGTWLHRYVITTLEVEMIMFGRMIRPASYLWSSLLTIVFSVLVNLMMYYKLRQIDMVESLKSVE